MQRMCGGKVTRLTPRGLSFGLVLIEWRRSVMERQKSAEAIVVAGRPQRRAEHSEPSGASCSRPERDAETMAEMPEHIPRSRPRVRMLRVKQVRRGTSTPEYELLPRWRRLSAVKT